MMGFQLPFNYSLYDATYSQVNISSNGNLQFQGSNPADIPFCEPVQSFSHTILAQWGGLNTSVQAGCTNCGVYSWVTGSAPNRVAYLHWVACRDDDYDDSCVDPIEFEVRLFEGQRRFDVVYTVLPEGVFASTGVIRQGLNLAEFVECGEPISAGELYSFRQTECALTPTPNRKEYAPTN
jgi:hypothetical protein